MTPAEYDVLIVGARVAGSSLALQLARRGLRVLAVDRDRFPSDTLSTHFMAPPAVASLARLGVLEDVLGFGFRRILRLRSWFEDCCFEGPVGPAGAFSLAPRRTVLDSVLIEHAIRAGAQFAARTRVDGLLVDRGQVAGAVLQTLGGPRHEVRARVVVGADGKTSSVAAWVGARKYREVRGRRPMYYGYFHGVEPLAEVTYELWFGGDQIAYLFPMRPDEDCLAVEIQPEDFGTFRADPRTAFAERVRRLPSMARRFASAELEGSLFGIRSVENYFRTAFGPGWVLTGDAGYLRDPSTGLGIGDALAQSEMLAEALGQWAGGTRWEVAMGDFQERRDAAMAPGYEATLQFMEMKDMPAAQAAVVKAVLSSPLWLRTFVTAVPGLLPEIYPSTTADAVHAVARRFTTPSSEGATSSRVGGPVAGR
jgi:flavin-dependent dehydrogenase